MKAKWYYIALTVLIIVFALFFTGCGKGGGKKVVKPPVSSVSPAEVPQVAEDSDDISAKIGDGESDGKGEEVSSAAPAEVVPTIKTDGFTKNELKEIGKDGYLSYFYRRKYSKPEIKIVWDAVNKLFPDYSREDKLLAVRSILAYHWVVYRTTSTHNLKANIQVAEKYRDLIKKYSELHGVPPEMVEAVIAWENSGGVMKRSWAACVGVGQLSSGAVQTSHQFYVPHVKKNKKAAGAYRKIREKFGFPLFSLLHDAHQGEAHKFDLAGRHREMRIKAGVQDERVIPDCNIEDAVVYLKLLYNNYDGRMDLAISAYHNGGLNNNDIIGNFLERKTGGKLSGGLTQKEIISALKEHNVSYIDLWKDRISRDMLNGLRTVEGHVTTYANGHLSLGDESDIYPWKIVAAYGALDAPKEVLDGLVDKYQGEWDNAECRGLRTYNNYGMIRKAIKAGWLAKLPSSLYLDKGIGDIKNGSADYYKKRKMYNYYVTPEMVGLLYEIDQVYRGRTRNPKVKLPIKAALDSRLLESYSPDKIPETYHTHLQGAALDVDLAAAPYHDTLYRILKEFYLHDHIYFIRKNGTNRIVINPRYGKYYFNKYLKFRNGGK